MKKTAGSNPYAIPSKAKKSMAMLPKKAPMAKLSPAMASRIRKKANQVLACLVIFLMLAVQAHAAPLSIQVMLGASATQIITTHVRCSEWMIQNNAAHNIRFGDSTVTSSKGIVLVSGTPGGSYTSTGSMNGSQPVPDDLSQWYISGTAADVIDVTCKQVI